VIMLFTFVHCVYVCRIMDGGCLTSAHSNQNTQANIESYHGALNIGLLSTQKALKGIKLIGLCGN
jgi:hypothetical protein